MIQFDDHIFQMGWFNHQPEKALMFLCVLIWFTLHVSWRHKGINPGRIGKKSKGLGSDFIFLLGGVGKFFGFIYFPVKKNCFLEFFGGVCSLQIVH